MLKTAFKIIDSHTVISEATTKFGGQPVWIHNPQWPLCPETGEKMLFLGQVALDQKLFPNTNDIVVYLFFSEESEPLYNEAFAAVIQTKEITNVNNQEVMEDTGPELYELDDDREKVYKEYGVVVQPVEEEEMVTTLSARYSFRDLDYSTGYTFSRPDLAGCKIGGQPLFIQQSSTPELFSSDLWIHILQLAPTQGYFTGLQPNFYPFLMELGEFGILNVFLSKDLKRSAFLVQQP
jgi:hypothetical protein